jgi:pyrroline-5-carboxylate reductase
MSANSNSRWQNARIAFIGLGVMAEALLLVYYEKVSSTPKQL